jgi:hypothetical protein
MTVCQHCGDAIPESNKTMRELHCCGKATCSAQRCYAATAGESPRPGAPIICNICGLPIHPVFSIPVHYDCA